MIFGSASCSNSDSNGAQNINRKLAKWWLPILVLLPLALLSTVEAFFYPTYLNNTLSEWFLDRQSLQSQLNQTQLLGPSTYLLQRPPLAGPSKLRMPQFVTFNTLDNIMTVDLNLAFPFMRVPITNTSNIVNLARDFMRVSCSEITSVK